MRYFEENNGLKVRAITGTRSVLLAFDANLETRNGLRGFSIRRTEYLKKPDGETVTSVKWLQSSKVFKSVEPKPKEKINGRFKVFRTDKHPIQKFFWSDYGTVPSTDYQYEVFPAYGPVNDLELDQHRMIALRIRTEDEDDGKHGIWFNRGAIASQHYAREFGNIPPTEAEVLDVNNIKTRWLSRGLLEACIAYIKSAKKGDSLHACLYEFTYQPIIDAFDEALKRGVKVRIIYHAVKANKDAIGSKLAGSGVLIERTRPTIPHNKFIIHASKSGKPLAVWTGSTNITMSGFLGQSNVGHLFRDSKLAGSYQDYWNLLATNPAAAAVKKGTKDSSPQPDEVIEPGSTPIFCARDDLAMLFWYGNRILDARDLAMFTVAFTVSPVLIPVLAQKRDCLRMLVMESRPPAELIAAFNKNGRDPMLTTSYGAVLGKKKIVVTLPNGKRATKTIDIEDFPLGEWFWREEHTRESGNVFFIHTKYLMIDPLSDDPLICTGSANFSKNSLQNNDENMVLIRGDTRVADIYLTEFLRLHEHFYFRDAANSQAGKAKDVVGAFLEETNDWTADDFSPGTYLNSRREMFFRDAPSSWSEQAQGRDPTESTNAARQQALEDKRKAAAKRRQPREVKHSVLALS
ncbi:phospholipase D-like domain-containing protein [Sinorhizobium sp. 7-81]|uniref:phospholipase D-like domain-containing protein n=1 Tax=Sinorhizobium sp. 8-89 TaxID=3049089 RepID=UPI0024C3D427|nr:phospholipase D-like domain-containing protein [Sinorhizobium sp. 8-89]MDK1494082.1 phospholipase D-like domain-containing protein [Sinorhizobium sp. 8-89]